MERTGANRLTDAATTTLNRVVAGSTAVLAAALQSLPLLGIGAAAYAALVAWDLTTRRREPAFAGLPAAEKLSDADAKRSVLALQAAHRELEAVLEKSPDQIAHYLGIALGTASELEDRAGRLALRLEELSVYLKGADEAAIRRELQGLHSSAAKTADAEAREQFTGAAASREAQLKTVQEIRDARDRVAAHLSRIVATYEALPARVVHMRALDGQAADAVGGDMGEELDRMNHEIAAFEETLKSLGEKVPA
jgi:hypothetical protein